MGKPYKQLSFEERALLQTLKRGSATRMAPPPGLFLIALAQRGGSRSALEPLSRPQNAETAHQAGEEQRQGCRLRGCYVQGNIGQE